jgi:hypothetical protein
VGHYGDGEVALQARTPGGEWKVVAMGFSNFVVSTPDLSVEYRFKSVGIGNQSVHVYMGP